MPSPQPSSTQSSNMSTPEQSSTHESSSTDFISYKNLSATEILTETQNLQSDGIHYAAKTNITSLCEFVYNKDIKGEMLVARNTNNNPSEFILAGIFEIDARNFFMTSDGKWNSSNPLGTRFHQTKATCQLLPVQCDKTFSFSLEDHPKIIANIRSIENLGNPHKSHDMHSIIINEQGQSSTLKLTHHLFIICFLLIFNILYFTFDPKDKKNSTQTINDDNDSILHLQFLSLYINTSFCFPQTTRSPIGLFPYKINCTLMRSKSLTLSNNYPLSTSETSLYIPLNMKKNLAALSPAYASPSFILS